MSGIHKSYGQIAYERYCENVDAGPEWKELDPELQQAWHLIADSVLNEFARTDDPELTE